MKTHYRNKYKRPAAAWRHMAVCAALIGSLQAYCADGFPNAVVTYDGMLPADSLPASYVDADLMQAPMPDADSWWEAFGDPSLTRLIGSAVSSNYNLRSALRRIEASRQMLRGVYSLYYPTVSLSAGYDLGKQSSRIMKPYADEPHTSYLSLGASLSWEIDVFGRVAEKARGSKATLEATRLEYEGMMLSVAAEVADDYSALRMYESQLRTARSHLESQAEMLKIVIARYEAGLVSKLDVAQARNTLNTTRLMIPQLEADVVTSQNALATLCGISREELLAIVSSATLPSLVATPGIGTPTDLVRRRPDVAQAERQVALYASQLGLVKKEWLPTLTVNASAGTSAHDAGDLFGRGSLMYSVSPQLSWTLFDGFSRSAAIAEARAEMEAEVESYNMTLLTAVQEVNNAIAASAAARRQLALYDDVISDSEEALKLSVERYKLGLTDFSDVATAQISLLEQQTQRESVRSACFTSLVTLYKSIGGGWNATEADNADNDK